MDDEDTTHPGSNPNSPISSSSPSVPSTPLSSSQLTASSTISRPPSPSAVNKLSPSKSSMLRFDGEWLEMGKLSGESDDEYVVRCCVNISVTNPTLRHIILLTSSQSLIKQAEAKKVRLLNNL